MNTKKIKKIMEEKGISQKMMAIDLDTTEAQISLIVNNKGNPRMATLVKFVEYLGLSFDEAIRDDDDDKSN